MNIYLCDMCGAFATRFAHGSRFLCGTCEPTAETIRPITPPAVRVDVSPVTGDRFVDGRPFEEWYDAQVYYGGE